MSVVVISTCIALFLTYLESRGKLKYGLLTAFIVLTAIEAFHAFYGTDYLGYFDLYNSIVSQPLTWSSVFDGSYYKEPGWVLLCFFFSYVGGFFSLVAVLSVIQNIIFYRFIRNNVPLSWLPMAVAIYSMSASLYILNFSMLRQGFTVALFLFAWEYIRKKDFITSLIIIFIASFIHSSAQILYIFVLWYYIPLNKGKITAILLLSLFLLLYTSSSFLSGSFEQITATNQLDSTNSIDYYMRNNEIIVTFGFGFFLNLIPFFLGLKYLKNLDTETKDNDGHLITISMLPFIIAPFSLILPMIGRFGFYFAAFQVVSMPKIYQAVSNKTLRILLLLIFTIMLVYSYYMFFENPSFKESYSEYHTIFEYL